MSQSTDPTEYSADESGYITSRPRGNPSTPEEYDSLEDSDAATTETPVRSPASVLPSPAPEHSPSATRGPRVRATARMSVPLPVRVTLPVPPRAEGEPSLSRTRSVTPPPVIGVPIGHPSGMTVRENRLVLSMATDIQSHRERLDLHQHTIGGLFAIISSHSESLDRAVEVIVITRSAVRRLYAYLVLMAGVLVVVLGLLVWRMMH
ncbi:hypothetical protein L6452_02425 [Arctium lappa]|uniref:Uncharacterized protein n=1 Tax=Arctium lappa TaxID=4217 RepID=A0ACB9FKC8_ARCLA|nr:hypothetical protein L6452_02425 [Arctium lappa]